MKTDFRTDSHFWENPKMKKLCARLSRSAGFSLFILWGYVSCRRATGVLYDMDIEDIEIAADWDGKRGELFAQLEELGFIVKNDEGVYVINEWAENNSWAANLPNRQAIGRLNGMASHYPELHQQLVAQGATGITAEAYAKLTAEYNQRGIIQSSSINLANLANLGNFTTPAPAPSPFPKPSPIPEKESAAVAEIFSQNLKNPANNAVPTTQAVNITYARQETPSIKAECSGIPDVPATIEAVIALWNDILKPVGFPGVIMSSDKRAKLFTKCIVKIPESSGLNWWRSLFKKMAGLDFFLERAGEKAWLTIDWVLNIEKLIHILEGKYDNNRKITPATKSKTPAKPEPASAPKEEPKAEPIVLPATTAELYAKIQAKPELTLEEYLRLKFPEAEEEELHRDYEGKMHEDFSIFPQRWAIQMSFETDTACAMCTDPKHCKLPERLKSALRTHSPYLVVGLCTDKNGKKFIGTKNGGKLICKHKCANCPSCVAEQAVKIPADVAEKSPQSKEAIPMPAKVEEKPQAAQVTTPAKPVDLASALGMRVSFDDKGNITTSPSPKKASKPGTWEADPYELEVIERERQMAAFEEYCRKEEEAKQAKAQAEINTPEAQTQYDEDFWSEDEDEYRLYGDTGLNASEEDEDTTEENDVWDYPE